MADITYNTLYNTNNYGRVLTLGPGKKERYVRVRFILTGHEDEFRKDQVIAGCIRDKYAVTQCGVGIIGNIKTKGKYKPYYDTWQTMIQRCYNHSRKKYKPYDDCKVCDRWKTFEYFYEDCNKIEGWNKESFENRTLRLDKDIKQRHMSEKVYSVDTCKWIPYWENSKIQDKQQRPFIAFSPDGTVYHDYNITDFAQRHGLERKHISGCLHNRCKTTAGWKFSYEEIA